MPDRFKAPEFQKIENIELVKAEKALLENEIPIFIINAGNQPVIRLEFIIKAGGWHETKPGVAYFTSKMLMEGTVNKSAKEISHSLDKFGAFLEINPGLDYITVALYSLNKHLASVLPIVKEILFEPSFPEYELDILKKNKIQNTRVNLEKTNYIASVNYKKYLFGSMHPYGRDLSESEVHDISVEDLKTYFRNNFNGTWDIIVSGLISDAAIKEINHHFGRHAITSQNFPVVFQAISTPGKYVINKESSLQSSIRVGKLLFTKSHENFHRMKIVNEILGGYFGSRLMKNLREEKGFTYGIHSALISLKNEGYFVIGTDVKKEFTEQTIEEIYQEIHTLQTTPINLLELDTVKNYMIGAFLSEINTPFALADKFKSVHLSGLDYNHYKAFIETVNSITPHEILESAQEYLNADSMTAVIAGGI